MNAPAATGFAIAKIKTGSGCPRPHDIIGQKSVVDGASRSRPVLPDRAMNPKGLCWGHIGSDLAENALRPKIPEQLGQRHLLDVARKSI